MRAKILLATVSLGLLSLGACSSSFGGGSSPPSKVIVVPSGGSAVCANGSAPRCP